MLINDVDKIMRKRLLNPRKLNIELDSLKIELIDSVSYRVITITNSYFNGGCQCFKDCNCSEKAATIKETVKWYRNVIFDGTDKCFYNKPYTPVVL